MTRSDHHGRLHPLSKTWHLSTKITLVSPFRHPETIKSDGTQRQIMVIRTLSTIQRRSSPMAHGDKSWSSTPFSSSGGNQVRWHVGKNHGHPHPFRYLESIKFDGTQIQIMVICTLSAIQRWSSPMACREHYSHLHLCRRLNVYQPRLL